MNQRTITLAVASLVLGTAAPAMAQEAHPHVATHHGTAGDHHASAAPTDAASSTPSPTASPEPTASAAPAIAEPTPPPTEATTEATPDATTPPEATPTVPAATPAPPPLVLRSEPRPERWVATVIAVGSLATTVAFGVMALNDQSTFAVAANRTQDLADATARDGMVADIFLGLTLVSAAAAIVLFVAPNADAPRQVATNSGSRDTASVHVRPNGFAVTF